MSDGDPGFDIDCRTLVELLTDYLDGALDAETERRLVAHLELCPPCLYYLDQLKATVAELGRVEPETLSEPTREGLMVAFRDWAQSAPG